jgi:hypothetical protein
MVVSFLIGVVVGGYAVSRLTDRQRSDTSMTENLRVLAAERLEEFAEGG